MHKALNTILEIQEFDMQMIQLLRLKKERTKEMDHIRKLKNELRQKVMLKDGEIIELKKNVRLGEGEIEEINQKIKDLESKQNSIKKVDEFTALSHEISHAERDRNQKEQRLSELFDKLAQEEEVLKSLQENLASTTESGKVLESEINEGISQINKEGQSLLGKRNKIVEKAIPEVFKIYEKLLRNKKDRVVVPIENRCCSGCHMMLTPQHENLVRRGERLIFCEHCSRIHYWQESEALEGAAAVPKRRRRRSTSKK